MAGVKQYCEEFIDLTQDSDKDTKVTSYFIKNYWTIQQLDMCDSCSSKLKLSK